MDDPILMSHPSMPNEPPVQVERFAFENAWKKRGWVAKADRATKPAPAVVPAASKPVLPAEGSEIKPQDAK